MGRNEEDMRRAPENLSGQHAMRPEPAARENRKLNVIDGRARRTRWKGRATRYGIAVEPPGMFTRFMQLKHVPDNLEGIPFGAGAMSAQGTRNVYADKHICSARSRLS